MKLTVYFTEDSEPFVLLEQIAELSHRTCIDLVTKFTFAIPNYAANVAALKFDNDDMDSIQITVGSKGADDTIIPREDRVSSLKGRICTEDIYIPFEWALLILQLTRKGVDRIELYSERGLNFQTKLKCSTGDYRNFLGGRVYALAVSKTGGPVIVQNEHL